MNHYLNEWKQTDIEIGVEAEERKAEGRGKLLLSTSLRLLPDFIEN